jgi:SAM-dependent methyltransferase
MPGGAAGVDASRDQETASGLYAYYFGERSLPLRERLLAMRARTLLGLATADLPTGRLLEIGPGHGFLAAESVRRGWGYEAIEANEAGAARLAAVGYDVQVGYVPPIPPLAQRPSLVLASHVIEHLDGAAHVLEFVRAMRDATGPGGRVCLAVPDFLDSPRLFWDVDYTHRWPSTARRLRQVIADAGLELLSETPLRCGSRSAVARAAAPLVHLPTPAPRRSPRLSELIYGARLFSLREIVLVAQAR